jgi:drug/metabolite transporter (DMT)-like permease
MQWRVHGAEIKDRMLERDSLMWLFGGGLFLALHFGAWVASLDETSLTHSLLFVTAHPLIIVFGMFLIARLFKKHRSPNRLEIIGACIGFIGAALALIDLGDEQGGRTVTIWGDFLAFLGAIFVVGYIVSGRVLRKWMPIFIYAFPVTLIGAILLIPGSMLLEDEFSSFGIFGWLEGTYFWWFLALALIAGLLGHTGLNTCLRYIPPLVVSTSVTMEPIIGSIIGYVLFDSGLPGFWTWIGGPVLISGIVLVVIGTPQQDTNNETLGAMSTD